MDDKKCVLIILNFSFFFYYKHRLEYASNDDNIPKSKAQTTDPNY